MSTQNYCCIVETKRITDKSITPEARAIFCYLMCYANKNMVAFPSRNRILRELGLTKSMYYNHFKQLCAAELIDVTRKRNRVNRYHIRTKSCARNKFCIIYKNIMTDPRTTLTAKLVFAYITAYCPYMREWKFRTTQIVNDLGLSKYRLKKALDELNHMELISIDNRRYVPVHTIVNTYEGFRKNADENTHEEVMRDQKNNDRRIKNLGHRNEKNQDTEEYNTKNSIHNSQSILTSNKTDRQIFEVIRNDTSRREVTAMLDEKEKTGCKKKEHVFFVIALLKLLQDKNYTRELNYVLDKYKLSLSDFADLFLERFIRKTKNITIRNPVAYMRVCLFEYTYTYSPAVNNQTHSNGYTAAYDISEYEKSSVIDDYYDDYSESKNTPVKSYQPTYDISEYENSSILDELPEEYFQLEMENLQLNHGVHNKQVICHIR